MKFQNLSVKRLFGWVAIGLVLSMSGITIALFFCDKTDGGAADGRSDAAVRPCRDLCTDAGIWKAAVAVYRRPVPNLRPHDHRKRSAKTPGGQ